MVGVPAQDRGRAVELFGQHDADELVGPGEGGEAQRQAGGGDEAGVEAVGATDHERNGRLALSSVTEKPLRPRLLPEALARSR